MPEKVELVFEREKSKEKPKELIVRYLSTQMPGPGEDCEVYPQGQAMPDALQKNPLINGERVYGVYRKTFFLTEQNLLTAMPGGGLHVLEYCQVDHDFFAFSKYSDPGPLWELLDTLKRRTQKNYKFTGPPHLRQFVRNLTDSMREDFQFKRYPNAWQAAICCKCTCEAFNIRYLGNLLPEGLLCDIEDSVQRTELICKDCGRTFPLFDASLHGYNVVICDYSPMPRVSKKANREYSCQCGSQYFRVAVMAFYDNSSYALDDIPARQKNDIFGWFNASVICLRCGKLTNLIDYECA
jgi:hypothetical protein